ncbi:major facilitator family protein transporter [Mycolicibacterium mageritense DSM 44476 = CIP 104973]|uniref:MFS transporter n=1 Tax=Mycolicibacterium mageritense TaxID=53462 RepID=A0ABM7I1A8_MYCME|nr:MFS transporter [Mycolicibacterium mageritense]MCC9184644.1 MFS transporter [Mycolicibacterium mageritense]TXI58016.1 MAG: MFS transporter [Mycolicibacterium mageritense]BBX36667.1 MFS transporter [Mycolicibacterium mageritense]CDO26300.1 major facilitator family protein transporter [Mycolicibacterium mageritense DSM 44476 = CIP 104973]
MSQLIDDGPLTAFHKRLTVFSAGGPFLDGFALTIIGIAFVSMKDRLSLDSVDVGLIGAAALIGIFVGGLVFGYVTDRVGRKIMYVADLSMLVAVSVASAFVTDAWQLVLLRFLLGVAIGADYPIASSLLAEFIPSRYRGRLLGSLFVVWAAGAAAAAAVGWALSALGPDAWRLMLASPAVFGVITLLMRAGTPESPRWLLSKGREADAQRVCRQVWGPQADTSLIPAEPRATSYSELFRGVYLRRVVFVGVFFTAHVIPLFAVYTFGPDILAEMGVGAHNVYVAELVISVLFLVGGVPGLLLVDKIGRKPLLLWTFAIMSGAFIVMAANPHAPAPVLFALLALYAITSGACNFIEIIYPNELFPTAVRASATGTVVAISRVGSAISTFVLPLVLTGTGLGGVMWLLAAVNVIGLAITVLLGEETRGRALSDTSAPGRSPALVSDDVDA